MDETPAKTEAAPQHAFKYTEFQDDPASTHSKIVSLVPPATRVLEFGCATGYLSEVLKNRLGCTVVGIEIDRDAAAIAEQHTERVIVGDAEKIDYAAELAGEEFDVVLFADVLEHLKEPADALRRVRPFVAENGVVVASIPNIAHASVRLALLAGEFRYRERGLLAADTLRFFTRDSIHDLFEETGYLITHWIRQRETLGEEQAGALAGASPAVREQMASDPEATTYQFIVRAAVSDDASQLSVLRRQLEALAPARDAVEQLALANDELGELRPVLGELANARAELESLRKELEALRLAHEVRGRRLIAERVAFAEGLAHIQATVYGSKSWRLTAPLRGVGGILRRLRR
jgi:2-polyprenyl-3-methyl-5-hydroxy-6-metoxy-1,4-benzoquinol methylase